MHPSLTLWLKVESSRTPSSPWPHPTTSRASSTRPCRSQRTSGVHSELDISRRPKDGYAAIAPRKVIGQPLVSIGAGGSAGLERQRRNLLLAEPIRPSRDDASPPPLEPRFDDPPPLRRHSIAADPIPAVGAGRRLRREHRVRTRQGHRRRATPILSTISLRLPTDASRSCNG